MRVCSRGSCELQVADDRVLVAGGSARHIGDLEPEVAEIRRDEQLMRAALLGRRPWQTARSVVQHDVSYPILGA
eukprot:1469158-Rhodomonas_salina.1